MRGRHSLGHDFDIWQLCHHHTFINCRGVLNHWTIYQMWSFLFLFALFGVQQYSRTPIWFLPLQGCWALIHQVGCQTKFGHNRLPLELTSEGGAALLARCLQWGRRHNCPPSGLLTVPCLAFGRPLPNISFLGRLAIRPNGRGGMKAIYLHSKKNNNTFPYLKPNWSLVVLRKFESLKKDSGLPDVTDTLLLSLPPRGRNITAVRIHVFQDLVNSIEQEL